MILMTHTAENESLEGLVNDHGAGIFRFLRSLVGDEDTARDLVQDTFLKLRSKVGGCEEIGKALVYTVARNCALDHLRRQRTRNAHTSRADFQIVAEQVGSERERPDRLHEQAALRRDLLAALAQLPEDQRTVFHLSEIEGVAYEDIAGILGVSPGTIASRKHHAVRKLRAQLRRQGHGE
jgi:RNA polymerase sigma-70 factor (ECF subfamily)